MTEKSEDTRNRYHIIARHHKAPVTVDADRHEQEKDKMIFYVGDSLISEVKGRDFLENHRKNQGMGLVALRVLEDH